MSCVKNSVERNKGKACFIQGNIQAVQIQSSFNSIQFKAQSFQNSAIQSSTVVI